MNKKRRYQFSKSGTRATRHLKKSEGHIQGAVADIAEIIERTLTTDKFDSQTITFKIERFSINQIIDENVEKIGKADRFIFDANELINMESDRQFVKIILSNLIDNAVKYSVESSPIRIAITRIVNENKSFLKLTIANQIGPTEFPDANRLFEKYYRAESAGKKTGSGLGLYLVKNLTQLLGGEVYYLPQQNGVIFTLMLPIESAVRA
jgi:signal transduction histidine kinase